jgi:AraC family transcriptional regulator
MSRIEGSAEYSRRRALAAAAQARIDAAPGARHRIRDLATALDVSPFHLAHVFRAVSGLSIHQYLLRVRMRAALSRLEAGEANISRLALDLGFSSHSHFTAVFQRHVGASPAAVRRGRVRRRA